LDHFLLERHGLRHSITDVHLEPPVVAESLPCDNTPHHLLELREPVLDLPNTDPTNKQKKVLIELRGEDQKDLCLKLLQTFVFRIEGLSLKAFEDVVAVLKIGRA
jgi:hypothetical protein